MSCIGRFGVALFFMMSSTSRAEVLPEQVTLQTSKKLPPRKSTGDPRMRLDVALQNLKKQEDALEDLERSVADESAQAKPADTKLALLKQQITASTLTTSAAQQTVLTAEEDVAISELPLDDASCGDVRWFHILPSHVPATRTRLIFDNQNTGQQRVVEWDPIMNTGVGRWVEFPIDSRWQLSIFAEPIRDPLHAGSNYAWSNRLRWVDDQGLVRTLEVDQGVHIPDASENERPLRHARITLIETCGRRLNDVARSFLEQATGGVPPEVTTRSFVGLGLAGLPVDDIASEIVGAVLRHVKEKAVRALMNRATTWICGLTLEKKANISTLAKGLVLGKTCELFKSTDLRSLAAQPALLIRSLVIDGVGVISNELVSDDQNMHLLMGLAGQLAIDLTTPKTGVLAEKAQGALFQFLSDGLRHLDKPTTLTCVTALAAALLSECDVVRGCDSAQLTRQLIEPENYYDLGSCRTFLASIQHGVDPLREGVLEVFYTVRVAKGVTGTDRVQRLLSGLLAFAEAATAIADNKATSCDTSNECKKIRDLGEGLEAFAHGDVPAALDKIRSVASLSRERFGRVFGILTAISKYIVLTRNNATAESVAAARVDAEGSLLALLDNALSREERQGHWIVGAGIAAQARMGIKGTRLTNDKGVKSTSVEAFPTLGLPVSFSLTHVLNDEHWLHRKGFQISLSPVDLGNCVSSGFTDVREVVQAAGSVEALFGDRDLPLTVGLSAGWRPSLSSAGEPGWFVTVDIGGYISFLDFN